MSTSSYSSFSSSGSASSGSSSSGSSSGASFTSCSTIVAPEQLICPFGSPEYNYFWIENRSKTNPRLSYFYNYKSHSVVWQRPVPNNISLPFYAHNLISRQSNIIQEDEDLIVSDNEDAYHKEKRLYIRKRNKRLATEDRDNSIQLVLINKAIKSKKMLDTLWKLYRYPGESKQDVKKRLFSPLDTSVEIKNEVLSSDCEYNKKNVLNRSIKQEPNLKDDFRIEKEINKTLKTLEEDSDSDPENVSFLIKQEYTMNTYYSDSEEQNDSDEENETNRAIKREVKFYQRSEEEGDDSDELDEEYIANEIDNCHIKMESFDEESYGGMYLDNHEQYSLADILNIEIQENDKENIFTKQNGSMHDDFNDQINWTFEKSSNRNNFSLNPLFKPPQLKKLSKKNVLPVRKKKTHTKKKPVTKLIIKNDSATEEKSETSFDPYKPIICDMYGTRTVNYNYPPTVKVPKWQSCSKLSDSDSDSDLQKSLISNEKILEKRPNPFFNRKKLVEDCLNLNNYFNIKNKKRKRKRSDSSWSEFNLSDYSDIDHIDIPSLKIKKEKDSENFTERRRSLRKPRRLYSNFTCTSSEDDEIINTKKQYKYTISTDNVLLAVIKREPEEASSFPIKQEPKEYKIPLYLNPVVDLSLVKIEPKSPITETETCVAAEAKKTNSDDNSSDSSSSSCTCSRSSCSCSSCSSSSEDTDIDDKEVAT